MDSKFKLYTLKNTFNTKKDLFGKNEKINIVILTGIYFPYVTVRPVRFWILLA